MKRFNVLDHFVTSSTLFDVAVASAVVWHDGENLSDHDPLLLTLNVDVTVLKFVDKIFRETVSWQKASDEDTTRYKQALSGLLAGIDVPIAAIQCHDPMCTNAMHYQSVNQYSRDIADACVNAGELTLPRTRHNNSKRLPGWNEFVKPAQEKSIFWHKIWCESGRPRSGVVADIMRRTRAAYHYAVRRVKRDEHDIVRQRFADSIVGNRSRDFWLEVKKMNGKVGRCAGTVEGLSDARDIANMFASKYENIYNSVPYDQNDMNDIQNELTSRIKMQNSLDNSIEKDDVAEAIRELKYNKNDGDKRLSTNHLKFAGDDLHLHLSRLLSCIVMHGSVPDDLLQCTTIPIPKGPNANRSSADNYRGITLGSVFGRIIDLIILRRYGDSLATCDLQFGFKQKRSTNICTMILKEVISYYRNNDTSIYCIFLDATKAFDRVEYCSLFRELLKRNIPSIFVRLLLNIYTGQQVRVLWNGFLSNSFSVSNGVKQGAILSPVLFCIYFDNLLLALRAEGIGCFIGSWFCGALAYADDVALLAPTAGAMRRLLSACDKFAAGFNVMFNAKKSKCLCIDSRRTAQCASIRRSSFVIGGNDIEFVEQWPHLGHIINSKLCDDDDIHSRKISMIGQVNNLLCNFSCLDSVTKNKLFQSYCCCHYGCELWDLSCVTIDKYCSAWRKALRKIWELPQDFRSDYLAIVSDCTPIFDEICRRSLNFIGDGMRSDSNIIRFITEHAVYHARSASPLGRNVVLCCLRYGRTFGQLMKQKWRHQLCDAQSLSYFSQDDYSYIRSILELLMIRDDVLHVPGQLWNRMDVNCCVNNLTLNSRLLDRPS